MDNQELAVVVKDLYKSFKLPHDNHSGIKQLLLNFNKREKGYEVQHVLNGVTFNIKKGEFFGIVGRNGSGKSTLLKLLAGIYTPSKGAVRVEGSLTPFIELGVGFNPELTGRENVFLNGALLGFSRQEMEVMYSDIVAFAELEKFMDQKLKNYSSGMQVRLAFSIAIRAKTDILLLDEVLAVGDAAFQRKCYEYFMKLKRAKKTVILVTHDMGAVRQYCDSAIMIEKGEIVRIGRPDEIAQSYQKLFVTEAVNKKEKEPQVDLSLKSDKRWGTGELMLQACEVKSDNELITINSTYEAKEDIQAPILGFSIYDSAGINLVEGNTQRMQKKTFALKKGETTNIEWAIPNVFKDGNYSVTIACCDQSAVDFYDWYNEAAKFTVSKNEPSAGVVSPNLFINKIS